MDVQLYIYDLSKGLARQISTVFLGTQIDAVYHTSIVMEGIEYVYDGGIKTVNPGGTHLGKPLEIKMLGKTELPMDVIMEYLESLKEIYTAEAYDIWTHNCNNFSNDFATFLLGTGIPEHITNLPQKVLNTPIGRALQPEINQKVDQKQHRNGGLLGIENTANAPKTHQQIAATVRLPTTMIELEKTLQEAKKSCAMIFFTSVTCPPCKKLYPLYDELATETAHKAILIKVDVSRCFDIGTKYNIRSTPTFMTFLHGDEEDRWSGADPAKLQGKVRMLTQMAWPPHPHELLHIPTLRNTNGKAVMYSKVPPLSKLKAKMGPAAEDAAVSGVLHFVAARTDEGAAEVRLPDLDLFSWFLRQAPSKLPTEIMFTIVDLLRVALVDPRLSGYYAEEKDHKTIAPLLSYVNDLKDCPYSLRLVALQTACNLFSSSLYPQHILCCPALTEPIVRLITTSLLDDKHHNVRVAAASLSFNIALANSKIRAEEHHEGLPEGDQIELAASLLEAIGVEEESAEALRGFLLAFGYLVYCMPKDAEMVDLLKSMGAQDTVLAKQKIFPDEKLVQDIGKVLLGKGLE
ncbi:PPPDE putative peptidase domain-containing protein [Halenospora varia]|nr:PPPDE putative peptidase domain-containing protein [Halenospora varia]